MGYSMRKDSDMKNKNRKNLGMLTTSLLLAGGLIVMANRDTPVDNYNPGELETPAPTYAPAEPESEGIIGSKYGTLKGYSKDVEIGDKLSDIARSLGLTKKMYSATFLNRDEEPAEAFLCQYFDDSYFLMPDGGGKYSKPPQKLEFLLSNGKTIWFSYHSDVGSAHYGQYTLMGEFNEGDKYRYNVIVDNDRVLIKLINTHDLAFAGQIKRIKETGEIEYEMRKNINDPDFKEYEFGEELFKEAGFE